MDKHDFTASKTKIMRNPYDEVAVFRDGKFRFEFRDCRNWIERTGKECFGSHFYIDPTDHGILYRLLIYAIGDEPNLKKCGLDLGKGILLTGPVGCGKTSLINLVRFFFPERQQYLMKSTRDISFEFERSGFKTVFAYVKGKGATNSSGLPAVFCFDDLGVEQVQKHFGNECDVMGEILLSRYDLFVARKLLTHATTNLSASEIEKRYGNRVRSRMREMFNLLAFPANSKDKRR